MSTDYIPISCSFYDELEAAAVKKISVPIIYLENNQKKKIEAKVVDFRTFLKEEFVILDSGLEIRLDRIVEFNNLSPDNEKCGSF